MKFVRCLWKLPWLACGKALSLIGAETVVKEPHHLRFVEWGQRQLHRRHPQAKKSSASFDMLKWPGRVESTPRLRFIRFIDLEHRNTCI